jgi:endonuclease VIII
MPEGDTVWLVARRLDQALAGDELTRTDFRVPKLATADLAGSLVEGVRARGKHLLMRVSDGWTVHSHLRMDGTWRIFDAGRSWSGGSRHQIRAVLTTARRAAVGYRLPVLELLRTADEESVVGYLGPDLLGDDWDADEALRRLLADPARPVGEALLDQRNLAGVGNVYKSELCFLRGVTPWTPVGDVPDPAKLVVLAKRLLERNKEAVARVTTGDPHRDRRLWVYGRRRETCRRCGTPIRAAELGPAGEERVTYWCPACQRGPGPNP